MSDPEPIYAAPVRPNEPDRSKSIVLIILAVAIIGIVALVVLGLSAYRASSRTATEAEVNADRFLTDMQKRDCIAATNLMTPEARAVTPLTTLTTISEALTKAKGPIVSWGKPEWFAQYTTGGNTMRLTYPITYGQGASKATLVMKLQPGGTYGVQSFFFAF